MAVLGMSTEGLAAEPSGSHVLNVLLDHLSAPLFVAVAKCRLVKFIAGEGERSLASIGTQHFNLLARAQAEANVAERHRYGSGTVTPRFRLPPDGR
jgi:hypothetical protein